MQNTKKIYGPPGTGKTHYLLGAFEEELKTVKPNRIAFLTFTRTARAEALGRASLPESELPYVKTIHAICYQLLNFRHDQLVTTNDLKKFGKKIGVHLTGYMPNLFDVEEFNVGYQQPTKADRLLQLNHLGRHRGLKLRETLKMAPLELDWNYAKWFTEAYRNWKSQENLHDYTDLLTEYLERGPLPSLDAIFIDEAQDLSWLQWQVVRKLGSSAERRYIAGDDDQAIFVWAGASADMFNTEPADEVLVLPQSYRIARTIHAISQRIISRVRVRQSKAFLPRESDGTYKPIGYVDSRYCNSGTSLILYRNFHRGNILSQRLEELGIPYRGPLSALSNPDVTNALEAFQSLASGHPSPVHKVRSLVGFANSRFLVSGIRERIGDIKSGELSAPSIFTEDAFKTDWYHAIPKIPHLRFIDRAKARYGWKEVLNPQVRLISIHQSKGAEADRVILDLELARRTYEAYMANPDDEHRVFYVAVTRAREELLTLMPSDTTTYML